MLWSCSARTSYANRRVGKRNTGDAGFGRGRTQIVIVKGTGIARR